MKTTQRYSHGTVLLMAALLTGTGTLFALTVNNSYPADYSSISGASPGRHSITNSTRYPIDAHADWTWLTPTAQGSTEDDPSLPGGNQDDFYTFTNMHPYTGSGLTGTSGNGRLSWSNFSPNE